MTQQNRASEPDEHQQENFPADTRKRAYRKPEFQYPGAPVYWGIAATSAGFEHASKPLAG